MEVKMKRKFSRLCRGHLVEVSINLVHPILLLKNANELDSMFVASTFASVWGWIF